MTQLKNTLTLEHIFEGTLLIAVSLEMSRRDLSIDLLLRHCKLLFLEKLELKNDIRECNIKGCYGR